MNVSRNRISGILNVAKICMFCLSACLAIGPALAQLSGDVPSSKSAPTASGQQIAFLQGASAIALDRQKIDAMNLFQSMQFGLACDAYRKICLLEPNSGFNHYWFAECLYEQSAFVAASTEFSRAANLDPLMEKAHVRFAEALVASRNYPQARDAAVKALANVRDERLRGRAANVLRVASIGAPHAPNIAGRFPNHCENRGTK